MTSTSRMGDSSLDFCTRRQIIWTGICADNITDALAPRTGALRDAGITKEGHFFYVARAEYQATLARVSTRMPGVGRSGPAVNYERVGIRQCRGGEVCACGPVGALPRIGEAQMRFPAGAPRYAQVQRLRRHTGGAQGYSFGPQPRIIDRYHVKTDKALGVTTRTISRATRSWTSSSAWSPSRCEPRSSWRRRRS